MPRVPKVAITKTRNLEITKMKEEKGKRTKTMVGGGLRRLPQADAMTLGSKDAIINGVQNSGAGGQEREGANLKDSVRR